MEFQKIVNFFNTTSDRKDLPRFCYKKMDQSSRSIKRKLQC